MSISVNTPTYRFQEVFKSTTWRKEFAKFLDNIFLQLDTKKFFKLIDDILKKPKNDETVYKELCGRIKEARHGLLFYDKKPGYVKNGKAVLRSLSNLKEQMADQAKKLLGTKKKVDGYMEIGFPGRFTRPMQKVVEMTGNKVVVNTSEQLSDYVQCGFPRPRDQFIPLNDYSPIGKTEVESRSLDLVNCFVGLHHVPKQNLDGFVKSLNRVLRPGGTFLLRDHDAKSPEMRRFVSIVHSVFNAATGVSPEDEKAEVRNFQGLEHWTSLLEKNGFRRLGGGPHVVEGDPTDNGMIRFEKIKTPEDKMQASLANTKDYQRKGFQTYLTSIEWHSVDIAREYADFVKHDRFYNFPFFKHVALLWSIFANSWSAARENHSAWEIITSDYFLMNLFITIGTSFEFFFKGIFCAPISWIGHKAPGEVEKHSAKVAKEYADYVNHTPFYLFSYFKEISKMWEVYGKTKDTTALDFFLCLGTTVDFFFKGLFSLPIAGGYQSEENKEPETIQMLVKDRHNRLASLDLADRIQTKEEFEGTGFQRVTMPRYRPFTEIFRKIARTDVQIAEIAGQKEIQLKTRVKVGKADPCKGLKGCVKLYEWPIATDPKYKYVNLKVRVADLGQAIRKIESEGHKLVYIHDF